MIGDWWYALLGLLPDWFWFAVLAVWLVTEVLVPGVRTLIEERRKSKSDDNGT